MLDSRFALELQRQPFLFRRDSNVVRELAERVVEVHGALVSHFDPQ
jgi:hypothetical protein